jgi:hypothetical protein
MSEGNTKIIPVWMQLAGRLVMGRQSQKISDHDPFVVKMLDRDENGIVEVKRIRLPFILPKPI